MDDFNIKKTDSVFHKFTEWTRQRDKLWLTTWLVIILLVWLWNLAFLNRPALMNVQEGFLHTIVSALLVLVISLFFSWLAINALQFLKKPGFRGGMLFLTFLLNLIRSIPQIVGILFGYVLITFLIEDGSLKSDYLVLLLMAVVISLFVFLELVDLMGERIEHFKKSDFFTAMLVCGINERRIINYDILWKNSRLHIFNKLIAIFGAAVFLQCSVDFIISVGLSTDVSAVNLPVTLGSLLANIDSKQDILAIGHTLMNPSYISNIFFEHLQGITIAFLIVFSLLSIYKISNGYADRNRL